MLFHLPTGSNPQESNCINQGSLVAPRLSLYLTNLATLPNTCAYRQQYLSSLGFL
jgi:hypothetical protein